MFLSVNKLDKVEYAVKKINILLSRVNLVYKILREVTVLAKLSHPNIVSYKTAWTEAYFGDVSSNESSRNKDISHSFEEIDDEEETGSEDVLDARPTGDDTNSGGIVFREKQSAVITEVSGSPSDWSTSVARVVGVPGSPVVTNNAVVTGGAMRGKFWRQGDLTTTECSNNNSVSVQFRSETSSGEKRNHPLTMLHRSNSVEADVAQAATLYIQMELCQETLRDWLDQRNSDVSASVNNR